MDEAKKAGGLKWTSLFHEGELSPCSDFGPDKAEKALYFHASMPGYEATPLRELKSLASLLGVKDIFVKDESLRFSLNAFKALGGSYAVARYIAEKTGLDADHLAYKDVSEGEARKKMQGTTFVTATDGNHGRGVAWTCAALGYESVVYMPKGSARERLDNILALGGRAQITDLNYDDAVRLAKDMAEKNGWVVVQDTSWEGYETIPRWIMQGYTTMALEAVRQLGAVRPTHIFLQAGVGAMAGAVTGFFAELYGDADRPLIAIVEPEKADCIFRSAASSDKKPRFVTGDLDSIMAGLCCGEPCGLGWEVLRDHADVFISMPDKIAALGMRILGAPCGRDERVISGESGAAGLGALAAALRDKELSGLKEDLGLDKDSVILCISTEGDTDRENYRKIVWDGIFPV